MAVKKRSDSERRAQQASRLGMVLQVLYRLQGHSNWNVPRLAEELEVSQRTIYRYLSVLELAGVQYYYDGVSKAYRLSPRFRFHLPSLTNDELLGQAIATATTKAPGLNISSGAKATSTKIAASSDEDRAKILKDAEELIQVLDLKLADHSGHQEMIRTVQWALIEKKQLTGQYASPYQDKPKKLQLHPYRLCLIGQAWYLVARPQDATDPRTYRIARFRSLRSEDRPSEVPADFDLRQFFGNAWGVYRGETSYEVEILFTPEAATLVTETTWHHTQKSKKNRDGSVTLKFHVDGLDEIQWWVLGWAGRAKVIQPPDLRDMVVKQLKAAIDLNS